MQNYHLNDNEDASEKEIVRVPSMDPGCMGGAEIEYNKKDSASVKRYARGSGYRIAAAGLAGAILAANTALLAFASEKSIRGEDALLSGSGFWWGSKDEESGEGEGSHEDPLLNKAANWWDEEEILDRWDLDPDDFPPVPQVRLPYIADELVPYFREAAAEAASWYYDETIPQADLSKYTLRADAIRRKVRSLIREKAQADTEQLLGACRMLAEAGGKMGDKLTYSFQDGVFCKYRARNIQTAGFSWTGGHSEPTGPLVRPASDQDSRRKNSIDIFLGGINPDRSGKQQDAKDEASDASESVTGGSTGHSGVLEVYIPSQRDSLPVSFDFQTEQGDDFTGIENQLPVPVGIYPYSDSYYAYLKALEYKNTHSTDEVYAGEEDTYEEDEYGSYADESGTDEYSESSSELSSQESSSEDLYEGLQVKIPFSYEGYDPEDPYIYSEGRRILFIGDSRTVGMQMFCGGMADEYWSAKNSMGYSWMVSTGIPAVEYLIDHNTDIVILMGVNDLGNMYNYIDYINMKAAEWKELGARTYFVSVTPVDDSRSPNAKNSRIENFNAYAQQNLRDAFYIDAYSRIRYSFGSPDGIHFDGSTYREIYRIIKFNLYRGWYEQDGLWFYFENGRPLTGWNYLDGQWQYMDGYGVRWVKDGRVGNLNYVPLPDFGLSGTDTAGLSF